MSDEQAMAAAWDNAPDELSTRGFFAAAALTGFLAAHAGDGVSLPDCETAADRAYGYADAMMKRRAPQPEGE